MTSVFHITRRQTVRELVNTELTVCRRKTFWRN